MAEPNSAVQTLLWLLKAVEAPTPELEFPFAASMKRKFRADLAWPERMLLAEIDGGSWIGGRHTSGAGFAKDAEKMSIAAALGFRVLRFTPRMVNDGRALDLVLAALAWSPGPHSQEKAA